MTRQSRSLLALLLIALTVFSGCTPTQPFYFHEDGDLSHYLGHATQTEHPDVVEPMLDDVTNALAPMTLTNPEFKEFWDLTLEEAAAIALQNSKVLRSFGGILLNGNSGFSFGLSANDNLLRNPQASSTIYDTALIESDPQAGVEAALSAFDAQLSVLGSNNGNVFSQTDRPSTFQPDVNIDRTLGGLRTELAKRSATGTRFFLRNQTDYTRGDNLFGGPQPLNSIWETFFEAEVRQPLLRGRGTQINRIPVVLARINTDVSLVNFETSVRNLLSDVENVYWDLQIAYRSLEAAKAGRDSAQLTWNSVYEKMHGGLETSQAEAQAREQFFGFRAQLESALRDLYNRENSLRFLMGIAPTDGRLIRPIDELTAAKVEFDWRQIHCEALMRSPELRQQKWLIQRRELELISARNNLLPQLDVGATYRWYGIGDHLINADRNGIDFVDPLAPAQGSTAFDVLTQGDYQEAALFLSFQMPVGNRQPLAGVRNAQLALARERARLEDMELNVVHLLSIAMRDLDYEYLNAQTQFNRWKASQVEVDAANALYQGGKTTLDQVLDAQKRRAEAQSQYYAALVNYNRAIAQIHFRKGSLLEYNSVQLAEGPWPEKAYWDALGHARERDASYYLDYGWSRPRVISQGPVTQHVGDMYFEDQGGTIMGETIIDRGTEELLPTPSPTPAERPESNEDAPRQPGPITTRPEGPVLNAPLRADFQQHAEPRVVARPANSFQWGSLGLDIPAARSNAASPATYEEPAQ